MDNRDNKGNTNNELFYLHCPECFQQVLFEVKKKENGLNIKYICSEEHEGAKGEMSIEEFLNSQRFSIKNLTCCKCTELHDNMDYCIEYKKYICENCNPTLLIDAHDSIIKKEDYYKICEKHINYYRVYCENCKKLLCEECPLDHIKHELSNKSFSLENEKINEIKNKENEIKEFIESFNSMISELKKKFDEITKQIKLELKLIKSIIDSCNNKKFYNYKSYLNFKNLKLKALKFNFEQINDILHNEYNIIDEYKVNFNSNINEESLSNK